MLFLFPRWDMLVPWSVGFRAQQQSRWTLFCFVGSITTLQWLFFGYQSVGQVKWSWRIYMSDIYMCASKTVHFPHKTLHTWGYRFGATPLVPDLQLSWCALTSNPQIWWTKFKVLANHSISGWKILWNLEPETNQEKRTHIHNPSIFCWFHVTCSAFFRGRIASKQKWRPFNFFGDSPNHGYSGPPFLWRYHRTVIRAKSEVAAFWRQFYNFCRDVWVL